MSGGGTLLDNGGHLLDIASWMSGDFVEWTDLVSTAYWKDCHVEETATGVFVTKEGKMATVASSWRELSGYFHFELNGLAGVEVRTLVDYGCGTGSHARRFGEIGIKLYGIDCNRHMLAVAREMTKGLQSSNFYMTVNWPPFPTALSMYSVRCSTGCRTSWKTMLSIAC